MFINIFSVEEIVRNYPDTANVVLATTNPPSCFPYFFVPDTVVNTANTAVDKCVFVVQVHNPGDVDHVSARLSHEGRAIEFNIPDHHFLIENRRGMAEVIGGGSETETNAFTLALTMRHQYATSYATPSSVTNSDIQIPMTTKTVFLPDGLVGSNEYFNQGDYYMIICSMNHCIISHLAFLPSTVFASQGGTICSIGTSLSPRFTSIQKTLTKMLFSTV